MKTLIGVMIAGLVIVGAFATATEYVAQSGYTWGNSDDGIPGYATGMKWGRNSQGGRTVSFRCVGSSMTCYAVDTDSNGSVLWLNDGSGGKAPEGNNADALSVVNCFAQELPE